MKFMWFGHRIDRSKYRRPKLKEQKIVFNVGNRIYYPSHGEGIITDIECKDGLDFFSIVLDRYPNVRLLVPMYKLRSVGAVLLGA